MRFRHFPALLIILLSMFTFTACTENQRAKKFGGTMTVDLPPGEKLSEVTWKDADLWYLTRKMRDGETPETYTFQEESTFGLVEGKVIFKEHPAPAK